IVRDDKTVTEEEAASANLILWGDPSSNRCLEEIAAGLPITWDEKKIEAGGTFYASTHRVRKDQPNPPKAPRPAVLHNRFTLREYDYLNNARQTPKLPDYAVIDVTSPPTTQWPGKVATAGFFDERWKLPKAK